MPVTSRPQAAGRHSTYRRKSFREIPDERRAKGNGHERNLKALPPETTNAESFYYLKQMNARTPMVIVMTDGEQVEGWIEWYDRNCLKVNREGAPNLLIQKHCVKYLYKRGER